MEPCDRVEREICAKEGESVFTIKRKREGTSICGGSTTKGMGYIWLSKLPDLTSPLCSQEEWKKENGTRLSPCKSVDGKEWVLSIPNCRHPGWSRKEEDVHKT